jgi:hypothetical protein
MGPVCKSCDGRFISDHNDWDWGGDDPDDWFPMDMRFTCVVVSEGNMFSGWQSYVTTPEVKTFIVDEKQQVQEYTLRNSPNPCHPGTMISFDIVKQNGPGAFAVLCLYDMHGRKVKTLANRNFSAGEHSVYWDGRDSQGGLVPAGQYIYDLKVDNIVRTREKLSVIR